MLSFRLFSSELDLEMITGCEDGSRPCDSEIRFVPGWRQKSSDLAGWHRPHMEWRKSVLPESEYLIFLILASFIDLHKKKGARNRQRQHRTKTGKSEGFNDSPENQIWLNAMLNETDDLLVLHGLLGSDRKIAAERTHQNLS